MGEGNGKTRHECIHTPFPGWNIFSVMGLGGGETLFDGPGLHRHANKTAAGKEKLRDHQQASTNGRDKPWQVDMDCMD